MAMAAIDPCTLPLASDLAQQLRAHVRYLASPELAGRKPGTPGNRAAAAYLAARFRELALQPLPSLGGYGQRISEALGDNLIGVRPASGAGTGRWLLLGAHYDHLGGAYLGADDNASAVAILLETARLLPPLSNYALLFVAFNTEEPPYIRTPQMGSQYFADHLPVEIGSLANLQAAVIMDLMGGAHWEPLRDSVFAAGAEKSPGLYRRVREAAPARGKELEARGGLSPASPEPQAPSPGQRGKRADAGELSVLPVGMHLVEAVPLVGPVSFSDYDAFRNAGVPFLFLSAGRTPRYHRPTDLPDTLHYERMAATVRWLVALFQRLDQDRAPYRFEPNRIELADEVATLRPLVALAARWETRIPGTSPLSLLKLKWDHEWLQTFDPAEPTAADLTRLERLSIRMQCLLADFPGCFLL
ncbi:M28 family metallopeptidase [Nitrospira sp. Kam-Ns4a]